MSNRKINNMNQNPTRAWLRHLILGALVSSAGLGALGCDTVAEISFDIRKYDGVAASGVANPMLCADDDSRVELRFALLDQENNVIRQGDQLSTVTVGPSTLNANSVSLDQGRLYSTADRSLVVCAKACTGDIDCEVGLSCFDGFCGRTDEDLPEDACLTAGLPICQPFNSDFDALPGFTGNEAVSFCRAGCATDADCGGGSCITEGDKSFCSIGLVGDFCTTRTQCPTGFDCLPIDGDRGGDGGQARKFCTRETTLQVANGSMEFVSRPAQGVAESPRAIALLLDNSGSLYGRGVLEDDRTVKLSRATDPDLFRIAAAKTFLLNLKSKSYGEGPTGVGVWSFRGESELGVKPLTGRINVTPVNPFVGNFDVARGALDTLAQDSDFGRSNVFLGIKTVAQNMIDLCGDNAQCTTLSDLRETTIVVFTDGPDDSVTISPGGDQAERDLGRQRWQARLDEAIATVNQAGAKVFIIHLDEAIGAEGVSALAPDPLNAVPYPRDAEGRTGPIAEFGEIACSTGGQYFYVTDPFGLNFYFDLLTDLVGGTWKVDIAIEALDSIATNGAYRFGSNVSVNLDGRTESFFLSPFGVQTSLGQIDTDDSRAVVFKRQGLDPEPIGGGDGGGDGGDGGMDSGE